MPPVRVLSLDNVATILKNLDVEDVLANQAKAFNAYSAKQTQTPQRVNLETNSHTTLVMPSRIDTLTSVIKVVSIPKQDSKNGLPGVTLVMDNNTGEPRGLVNARLLTAIRTAAGSALATRAIFSTPSKKNKGSTPLTLVVFGSGAQAKAHIQLLTHVLPQITTVIICNRTLPRALDLLTELQPQYSNKIEISAFSMSTGESKGASSSLSSGQQPKDQLKRIVQSADIICTCTNSLEALFPGEWVKPGAHINMVGSFKPHMHEVDQTLIKRAFTVVDAQNECQEEAGELILAIKESGYDGILTELGQIFDEQGQLNASALPSQFSSLPSSIDCKESSSQTTGPHRDVSIFKSVGIAAQDVAITSLVLDKAETMDLGSVVEI
ncbi:hypothetical protein BG011_001546 [Mortierella polycephala]|uniref:NAD(P)-binding protein n=1 Tax=Mortierella polycephala TaxID=41804 RepID=A0A9P6U635_9FUNG|nr:hypothetical protein BG011_001546 [Mortierella polycephala]